jgi:predicted aldo/keto reductase-like oxidoreductase
MSPTLRDIVLLGKGKAAFEVSALGFGVMGMTYNRSQHPDKKQCIRLLHEAVDRGVTLFDTAHHLRAADQREFSRRSPGRVQSPD